MKRIFTLLLIIPFLSNSQALFVEDFNFPNSFSIGANGWTIHSGTADSIFTTSALTYPGYANSGIGAAANVIGAGFDYNKRFADQNADGTTIYMSALVNFTEVANSLAGGYFLHLGNRADPGTTFTSFCARVWAKVDASGNVNLGVTNINTAAYSTINYSKNTTYLLIIKYTINTAGADNIKMWIRSSGVPATEAAAGTPDIEITSETGLDFVNAVGIRQASGIPDVVIDGIRVATDWFNAPLPVSLKSFNASLINNKVALNWNTTNENNVDGFTIEKSNDGRTFSNIGFVAAKNAAAANYAFNDVLAAGVNYYRLKITDKDGSFKYSSIVAVNAKQSTKLDIFPNPVVNTATLSHTKAGENSIVKLITIDGKTVLTQNIQAGATQSSIDVSKLIKGNYLVVFENDGNRTSLQFVKQ